MQNNHKIPFEREICLFKIKIQDCMFSNSLLFILCNKWIAIIGKQFPYLLTSNSSTYRSIVFTVKTRKNGRTNIFFKKAEFVFLVYFSNNHMFPLFL